MRYISVPLSPGTLSCCVLYSMRSAKHAPTSATELRKVQTLVFIISHRSAIEFWRLVRFYKLPRCGIKRWMSDPMCGIQLVGSGAIWKDHFDSLLKTQRNPDIAKVNTCSHMLPACPGGQRTPGASECNTVLSETKAPSIDELRESVESLGLLPLLTAPLHVMVPSESRRSKRDYVSCHIHSVSLPNFALYRVCDSIYVCSPVFAFVQMAHELSRPKLVRLGLELCGGYSIAAHTSRGFCDCYPITTPDRLLRVAHAARRTQGNRHARLAAKRVAPGCASPAEADFDIQLTFPRAEGGRGIEQAELNAWVPCSSARGGFRNPCNRRRRLLLRSVLPRSSPRGGMRRARRAQR